MIAKTSIQTRIGDTQTRKPFATLNGTHPSFSSDGRFLAVVVGTNRLAIQDASDPELRMVRELTLDGRVDRVPVFARDHRWVAVACQGRTNTLAVWSLASADGPIQLRDPQSLCRVTYCHFSPDSKLVAVSHDDCTTRFWRIDGWRPLLRIEHPGAQWPVVFSPDSRWMAVGVWDMIRVFDVGSGKPRDLRGHAGMVVALAFTPDGRTLGVGTHQGQVQLWNVSTWREVAKLAIHSTVTHSLAFAPDGRAMATTCFNDETKLMFVPGYEETDVLPAPPPVIRASLKPQ